MCATVPLKSKAVFRRKFLCLTGILAIISILWVFAPTSVFSAEVNRGEQVKKVSRYDQSKAPVSLSRGRSIFNAMINPSIVSKREWQFQDWIFFVMFVIASIIFLMCLLLITTGNPNYPEHIVFATAILSGSIALPWYLSLFALPKNILQWSTGTCSLTSLLSGFYLIQKWIKEKKQNKKPDIFLE